MSKRVLASPEEARLSVQDAAEALGRGDDTAPPADAATAEGPDGDQNNTPNGPPEGWDDEAAAKFADLPPEVQAQIHAHEDGRNQAASDAVGQVLSLKAEMDGVLPQALDAFAQRWDGVDWDAWAAKDPQGALQARLAFEKQHDALQQMSAVHEQAEMLHHHRHVTTETAKLKSLAPDLADPLQGSARKQAVAQFLLDQGAHPHQLSRITAAEAALAYDALRWRQAQARLAARPRAAAPSSPTVKPTASAPETSPRQRQAQSALQRLAQSGSLEDAVAYLKSRG